MGIVFDIHTRLSGADETVRAFLRYRVKQKKISPRNVPPEIIIEIIENFINSPTCENEIRRIAKLSQGMKGLEIPYIVIEDEFLRRIRKILLMAKLSLEINRIDIKIKEFLNEREKEN
jgi:hypothetical protein